MASHSEMASLAVDLVTAQIAEEYPELVNPRDVVVSVLAKVAAAQEVAGGDPVGTIRLGDGGELAKRVVRDGLPVWQVTDEDGVHYDAAPTLDWELLRGVSK